jgi:hypothetical protein
VVRGAEQRLEQLRPAWWAEAAALEGKNTSLVQPEEQVVVVVDDLLR